MTILDLTALESAVVEHDPYDYIIVPAFVKPDALPLVNRDFPEIKGAGNQSLDRLRYGPAFQQFLDELSSADVARRLARKFGLDLVDAPTTTTVRARSELSDGDIHTDHWSKLVTAVLYFNEDWRHDGGKLRVLRSADDIEDYAAEIPPVAGTMFVFKRSEKSFHGHKRHVGERRMVQISWVRSDVTAQTVQKLDRLSTRVMKSLTRPVERLVGRQHDR